MYTVSSKLKIVAAVFMIIGLLGVVAGFLAVPANEAAVEQMLADEAHHTGGHGDDHITAEESEHVSANQPLSADNPDHSSEDHGSHAALDAHDEVGAGHDEHSSHIKHVFDQLRNKPWAAVYVAAFFFFMIGLGTLAFYAVQKAAQAGWSPVLFRVMEGIASYILPGGIIMYVLLVLSALHFNHIFHWMAPEVTDPNDPHYDALIAGKTGFLNVPFFLARAAAYLIGWNLYRHFSRKFSLKQDEEPSGNIWYKKSFKHAAMFLVFFIVTESIMSWDWIMSFDPHWFSTLFGWYVFASMFVAGITTIALVTIYLKSLGLMTFVNDSHIHDLAKFMFGISVFWTYLWFSQFMLIWYSNIPEEVTYFVTRIQDYNILFFGMVVINFLFPVLILMNSDFKRINWFVVLAGIFILIGHYLDVYVMVMPSTVGASWYIGFAEVGAFLFFGGLFMLYVFNTISKAPLLAKGDPYLEESKHFHY